jgi:hypothetical protein
MASVNPCHLLSIRKCGTTSQSTAWIGYPCSNPTLAVCLLLDSSRRALGSKSELVARFRTMGRGKRAHTLYQCYNKGLGLAFDGPGSSAYLLRGPMALLIIIHGALVCYTISRKTNIISDSSHSEAKGKSGFPRVYRGVSCRFGHGAPPHIRICN